MKKQLAALFAAGTLLVTMGAGCSSQTSISTTPTPEPAATSPDSATAPETTPPVSNAPVTPAMPPTEAQKTSEEKPLLDVGIKAEVKAKTESAPVTPAVKSFNLKAKKFSFEPATITVTKGETVKLTITSEDTTHGFALSDFNAFATIEAGKTANVQFVADKAGTFSFFCSVFCGGGHGDMKGSLIVK